MNQKAIIISAPSGAGKTSIVKYLMNSGLPLDFSVSAASRAKRANEVDGKDYYFISADEFRKKISNDEFLEWEEVYVNQFYGTLKSEIDRIWQNGKVVIFDVDVKGGVNIKKYFGEKALSIFVKPPTLEELKQRLANRGTETEESLNKRVAKSEYEMTFEPHFDEVILNDDLATAQKQAFDLIDNFIKH